MTKKKITPVEMSEQPTPGTEQKPATAPAPEAPETPVPETPETPESPEAPETPEAPEPPADPDETETSNSLEEGIEIAEIDRGAEAEEAVPNAVRELRRAYPGNKEFHMTTDGLVFLKNDYQRAVDHQKTLKGEGELKTYKF